MLDLNALKKAKAHAWREYAEAEEHAPKLLEALAGAVHDGKAKGAAGREATTALDIAKRVAVVLDAAKGGDNE